MKEQNKELHPDESAAPSGHGDDKFLWQRVALMTSIARDCCHEHYRLVFVSPPQSQ